MGFEARKGKHLTKTKHRANIKALSETGIVTQSDALHVNILSYMDHNSWQFIIFTGVKLTA